MKLALLLPLPCLSSAFTTPVQHLQRTPVALSASRDNFAAAAALAVGLGLAQVAGAVTTVDQFTLPSYDSSKGVTVIDLKDEVQDVNKKTMAAAKAKREVRFTRLCLVCIWVYHCNYTCTHLFVVNLLLVSFYKSCQQSQKYPVQR